MNRSHSPTTPPDTAVSRPGGPEPGRDSKARQSDRLAFLAEASRLLGESLDYRTTLHQVARLVVPKLADWCSVDLLEDGELYQVAVAHVDPAREQWARELRKKYPPDMSSPHGPPSVLRTGRSELYPEISDEMLAAAARDAEHLELMRKAGFTSVMVVPLLVRGRAIGVLSFVSAESGQHYGEEDLLFAEDLARRAAVAVENSRLHSAEQDARASAQQAVDRLRRLQAITENLSDALTVAQVAEIVVDQGLAAMDADAGSIALLSEDRQTIEVVRTANYPQHMSERWKRFAISSDAPLAESVRRGEALFFQTLEELRSRYPSLNNLETPNRAFAAVPLVVDRVLIGSLGLSFRQARRFTSEDREFISAVAKQCGQAIQRARLYEAERAARRTAEAARERLTFLSEASTVLAVSLEYGDTLAAVAQVAVPTFADFSLLFLLEDDGNIRLAEITHVNPERKRAMRDLLTDYPLQPDVNVGAPRVLRTGEPELVPEFTDEYIAAYRPDPEFQRRLRALGIRSRIVTPLRARGRTFGALALLTSESGRNYTADDLALAEELSWRAAIALDNARLFAEVREADRRKDEFLALLGHELRNPLELLERGSESGCGLDPREIIRRQVQLMVRLVDDLLDVSRITRDKIELRKAPVVLQEVARHAIQTSLPHLEERGHALHTEIPERPIWLEADATRLEQVIANLLNNAAKYTRRGGTIRLRVTEEPGNPPRAALSIADNGIGIERAMLNRIFAPFAQANSSLDREYGGLGLGLTLVQNLVQLHGGEVSVHSDGPGYGSEFTVRLPLLAGAPPGLDPVPGGRSALEPCEPLTPERVLVVDDNVDGALTLAEILQAWGLEASVAHSGQDALKAFGAQRPTTVLLDIGMPGMDGYEVARRLRALSPPTPGRLRLVALTGYGQDEDRRRARDAGFDHHFTKPVDLEVLRKLLTSGKAD
jgi:signal transduction histidine kinase/ActR/RegA family two-component response regulator/putative methionine-R-sulfoxide reductase with GAF domain